MIQRRVTLNMLVPTPGLVHGLLSYDARNPLEVMLTLNVGHDSYTDESRIDWVFARSLLHDGLRSSSGLGDVTVSPIQTPDCHIIILNFVGMDRYRQSSFMTLSLSWSIVERFLVRTYLEVSLADELKLVEDSVNGAIEQILAV